MVIYRIVLQLKLEYFGSPDRDSRSDSTVGYEKTCRARKESERAFVAGKRWGDGLV